MINTRKELKFYLKSDFIMNRGKYSIKNRLICFASSDLVIKHLRILRKYEYYLNNHKKIFSKIYKLKIKRISYRTGISIAPNVFSYGLVIPHHGTIVVGGGNTIGKYCVLHTSTCITEGNKKIGDGFYLSSGSKVYKDIVVYNNVSLGMNSVVNSDLLEPDSLFVGSPAIFSKKCLPWYLRDGSDYSIRVKICEQMKEKLCQN